MAESGGNSILEYSLAELAFILFFLLLLFIGYEITEHQDELKDRDEQITNKDTEIDTLNGTIAGVEQEKQDLNDTVSNLQKDIDNITKALPAPQDGEGNEPNDVVNALRLAEGNAEIIKDQTTQISGLKEQLGAAQDENARTTQQLTNPTN